VDEAVDERGDNPVDRAGDEMGTKLSTPRAQVSKSFYGAPPTRRVTARGLSSKAKKPFFDICTASITTTIVLN
jgi:hypothetical protein